MSQYIYLGSQPYEDQGLDLRVEPSAEGTPFSAEFDPAREARLIASGLIRKAALPREGVKARKGER